MILFHLICKYWIFQLYDNRYASFSFIGSSVFVDSALYTVCFVSEETPLYLLFVLRVYSGSPLFYFRDRMSHAHTLRKMQFDANPMYTWARVLHKTWQHAKVFQSSFFSSQRFLPWGKFMLIYGTPAVRRGYPRERF